ncbi:feruloyl esterase [Sphingobium sp. AP50]|uniref:tannase/feruloyl esterase family alpha/beta hydrolase n=1 Tax=Sphingobium sp. AP50 TaxID=1884369 RepID=UPI0008B4B759|nr:tannase/feruloyl esterase family alpha/beta hydrolase [Sphingobium sp. AP50]SEJ72299.1 feruloyl esterase [Sphingobium sp. AP50]
MGISYKRTSSLLRDVAPALALVTLFTLPTPAAAQEPPRPLDTTAFGKPGADCAELRYTDFSRTDDAITQITLARPIAAEKGVPAVCEVEGYVWRQTRFRLRFPLQNWNGKIYVQGTGGQAGGLPNDTSSTGRGAEPLRRGFASVSHNGGHYSTITDAQWSYNDGDAQIDSGFRGPHAVTMASKAIVKHFFGRPAEHTYYDGCSNGGREAMMMAQRFPYDFDGIIAGAPSIAVRDIFVNMYWIAELMRDQSRAGFDMAAAKTLHSSVIAQCDKLDGKIDKIMERPRECKVDFTPIICKQGPTENCLTPHQVDIARKIYEGPRDKDGKQIAPSSAFPGSEISWVSFITPRWTIDYANDFFRYSAFSPAPGPNWKPDPSKLAEYAKRMGVIEGTSAALNPDLRQFKANGGKLISYYGWNDAFGGSRSVIDYYEAAERVSGGLKNTQEFFRLFMVPGMDHCGGGEGASVFDWLTALDTWVVDGKAPDSMTGFHPGPEGKPEFTRTVLTYKSRPFGTN